MIFLMAPEVSPVLDACRVQLSAPFGTTTLVPSSSQLGGHCPMPHKPADSVATC